jgi:hypothetical protein
MNANPKSAVYSGDGVCTAAGMIRPYQAYLMNRIFYQTGNIAGRKFKTFTNIVIYAICRRGSGQSKQSF